LEPEFDELFTNVTVVAGHTATLPCSINFLGKHKVPYKCSYLRKNFSYFYRTAFIKFNVYYPNIQQYGGYLVYCVFVILSFCMYGYKFLSSGKR